MGFLDSLLGRSTPPPANLDILFQVPQAAISLQTEGFTPLGSGSVCYRDAEGKADDLVLDQVTQVITTDSTAKVTTSADEFGFTWLTVDRPGGDITGLVTDLHAANSSLADNGFDQGLLCSTFLFSQAERTVAIVYLFKRGSFYPFAPEPGAARRRDNALELQIRGIIGNDVPVEADLSRWLAVWGAPGL